MPWDDDADDEETGVGPPLPPDDRLWRHPSELGSTAPDAQAVQHGPAAPAIRPSWAAVALAGLGGAAVTFGLLSLTGGLSSRVIEQPVVEKVAMTPVVPSAVIGDSGSVEALVARVAPAIVRLDLHVDSPDRSSSGVIFRDDGLILTSARPLRGHTSVTAVLSDGRRLEAEVLGTDEVTDIAVVKVDAQRLPVAVLGSSEGLDIGAPAVVLGSPPGHEGALATTGLVSATSRKVATVDGGWLHGLIQTDAPVKPGCFGGPLVDTSGAVIGITTSLADDPGSGFGFATPVDVARRVADQLVSEGRAVHGWLGIAGDDVTADDARRAGFGAGAVVRQITSGSPADVAGLREGDLITRVDKTTIRSMSALVVELRDRVPGDEVLLGYWRDGTRAEATVSLGERPPDEI